MSDGRRIQRVEKELLQIISEFLVREYQGESDVILTVTRVVVAKDLRQARVYFTFFSPQQNVSTEDVQSELQSLAAEVQSEIARSVRMKFNPKLEFTYDEAQERIRRVEELIRKNQNPSSEES